MLRLGLLSLLHIYCYIRGISTLRVYLHMHIISSEHKSAFSCYGACTPAIGQFVMYSASPVVPGEQECHFSKLVGSDLLPPLNMFQVCNPPLGLEMTQPHRPQSKTPLTTSPRNVEIDLNLDSDSAIPVTAGSCIWHERWV